MEKSRFNKKDLSKLIEALEIYENQEVETIEVLPNYEFSEKFKREMNRFFREDIGINKVPHPEVKE